MNFSPSATKIDTVPTRCMHEGLKRTESDAAKSIAGQRLSERLLKWLVLALVLCGCSYKSYEPSTEGETHWLKSCENGSACGNDGTCICGVCTTGCKKDSDCTGHHPQAVCANSIFIAFADGCSNQDNPLVSNLCVLPCEQDADCTVDNAELVCAADLCVDIDHDLANRPSEISCPENRDFQCKNATPSEMITSAEYLDDNGCLRRQCQYDDDCLKGEICYISKRYREYDAPNISCKEAGGECSCVFSNSDDLPNFHSGYCLAPKRVTQCPNDLESDPILVSDEYTYIEGDVITLSVSHGGGCADHDYALCYADAFLESDPVQVSLQLIHDAGGDECDAELHRDLYFDLTPLKQRYQKAYQTESGLIETPYGLYAFGPISCEERTRVAGERIQQAQQWADNSCNTDADCVNASNSISNCYQSCGSIMSLNGKQYFDNRLNQIEQEVCENVEAAGCEVWALPCEPPLPIACVNETCVETEYTSLDNTTVENPDAPAFALFLLKDQEQGAYGMSQSDLDSLVLQDEPMLTDADMAYYNWPRHTFSLSYDSELSLPIETNLGPFVVVSQDERQYVGTFNAPFSSMIYPLPTIEFFLPYTSSRTFVIEPGYPEGDTTDSPDPRENTTIKEALRDVGKLIEGPLLEAMKGYEIYSWNTETSGWRFTLIAGTNRIKTCSEITAEPNTIDYGFVNISIDDLLASLSRVAVGERLFWIRTFSECDPIQVPESEIVEAIQEHCSVLGLQLDGPSSWI